MTRRGIEYNLTVSPYKSFVKTLTFYFSSQSYRNKFESQIDDFRKRMEQQFEDKYGMIIKVPYLAELVLYSQIEKRGFFITNKGSEYKCLEEITLNGNQVLKQG